MTDAKPLLQSRTVWANLVGLLALGLGLLGYELGDADIGHLADALAQIVVAASLVLSTIFRVVATKRLDAR